MTGIRKGRGTPMEICADISYRSINKDHEELCGDKVEVVKTADSDILILADGMGSGVKANILATLTSKILGTMLLNGATIDQCVETIVKTLPVCQVRQVAYSTFSILQVFRTGEAYLVEFDNPSCIFIRDGKLEEINFKERIIEGKKVKEFRFTVKKEDCFVLMSDGAVHAGVGQILNFGWTWKHIAAYAVANIERGYTAHRFANLLCKACDDLYMGHPGDDTTIAVMRAAEPKVVNVFTGPPLDVADDEQVISAFMQGPAKKVICGGTSANIAARILEKEIKTSFHYSDPDIPPTASIDGIDLVTEGVITMSRTLQLLRCYIAEANIDEKYFLELDKDNGGSMLARMIIEECTHLKMFVGKRINSAHQNPNLPFDLSIRMNLVEQIKEAALKMGKEVTVMYY